MVKFKDAGLPKEGALYVATTSVRLYSVNVFKGDAIQVIGNGTWKLYSFAPSSITIWSGFRKAARIEEVIGACEELKTLRLAYKNEKVEL